MSIRRRLIAGIAAGVVAFILMLTYVASIRAEENSARQDALARYGGEQVEVCVASRDILPGETIDGSNTATASWLVNLLPADAITDYSEIEGAKVSSTILENEPIASARLEGQTETLDVPDGLCAVSVPAKEANAVGGALGMGSVVDVYAHTDSGFKLLGTDLLVLATSNSSTETASSKGLEWVTLAVTPESVQELLTASYGGSLYFALPGSAPQAGE